MHIIFHQLLSSLGGIVICKTAHTPSSPHNVRANHLVIYKSNNKSREYVVRNNNEWFTLLILIQKYLTNEDSWRSKIRVGIRFDHVTDLNCRTLLSRKMKKNLPINANKVINLFL